jgi:S-DNA-T family DNA segregation ATPase FtsK/SpoIIIE
MAAARTKSKPAARKASTAKKKAPVPARATRSRLAARPSLRFSLALEPHQLDILGLALVAIGIFLAGVDYLHWAGGTVGNGSVKATKFVLGELGYAVPVGLFAAGGLVLARELRVLGSIKPVRTGTVCLVAALTLALTGGTLGLGPGRVGSHAIFHAAAMEARGGILGAVEYWASSHLFSTVGSDILAVFMLLAGAILLSGATLASWIRITGNRMLDVTRGGIELTPAERLEDEHDFGGPVTAAGRSASEGFEIPEPETAELIVRATHVEAPPIFAPESEVELFDEGAGTASDEDLDEGVEADSAPFDLADEEQEWDGGDPLGPPAPVDPEKLTPAGRYRASVTDDPDFVWRVPSSRSLTRSTGEAAKPDTAGQEEIARNLVETLGHFGIDSKVIGRVAGPHITRYELRLAPGTKVSKVANLKDDIAYALAATDVRILAPIPGKTAVGIEVPNLKRRIVHLGDVFQDPPEDWSPLTVWLGKDIGGRAIGADLAKMPHLLVAGTTGAGKSACVNAMLSSILLRATPHECRLVLVDPKQVELNHYESIPHLLTPVITSPRMAANALQNLVKEMEQRYGIMSLARTRSLPELNRYREKHGDPALPYILCVIDELADLMMVAPADVEDSIIRLAQKARAVGIHLVLATQSPRVDVITGMIKANVPSRIAFAVSSQTDSRVILDQNGAESLLGQGDMLFSPVGSNRVQRIQGAYIDEDQILELTEAWRRQGEPEFQAELLEEVKADDDGGGSDSAPDEFNPDEDPLLEEAISLVAQMGTASTSMLQRRLRLGYTRAGRLIDMLERRGIISGYEGSKPRQVLITEADVPRILVHFAEASRGGGGSPPPIADPVPAPPPSAHDDEPGVEN